MRLLRPPPLVIPLTLSNKYTTTTSSSGSFNPQTYHSSALHKFRTTPPRHIPAILTPDRSLRLTESIQPFGSPSPSSLKTLPQGHHMVYFEPVLGPHEKMLDGTDVAHWPGGPFVRRMWAGGSVTFHEPSYSQLAILDGKTEMVCVERVKSDQDSDVSVRLSERDPEGGADKVFVELEREYHLGGINDSKEEKTKRVTVMEEKRRLVFMKERKTRVGDDASQAKSVKAPWKADYTFPLMPTEELLRTFSDLTNNAHLIHLDREYAQKEEGYKDVLVQGPLTLVLMLVALRGQGGAIKEIEYRNLSPLFSNEPLEVCLKRNAKRQGEREGEQSWAVWIEGPEGRLAVRGRAVTFGDVI